MICSLVRLAFEVGIAVSLLRASSVRPSSGSGRQPGGTARGKRLGRPGAARRRGDGVRVTAVSSAYESTPWGPGGATGLLPETPAAELETRFAPHQPGWRCCSEVEGELGRASGGGRPAGARAPAARPELCCAVPARDQSTRPGTAGGARRKRARGRAASWRAPASSRSLPVHRSSPPFSDGPTWSTRAMVGRLAPARCRRARRSAPGRRSGFARP